MRLRIFALLGSLALLAVLGAPTLAMSMREQLPTAPWQGARGPVAALSGRYHGWMQKAVTSERDYLLAMLANRRAAVAADLRLERSPRPENRALGATSAAVESAQLALLRQWLQRWYPASAAEDPPSSDPLTGVLDRDFVQEMIRNHMVAVMLSQQLLVRGLAVHSEVARLAVRMRDGEHAELLRMRRWLAMGFPRQGMGRRMSR
jgi:uncharacterized protein (DUF305 family)